MQDNEKLAAGAASDLNAKLDEEIKMNYCYNTVNAWQMMN